MDTDMDETTISDDQLAKALESVLGKGIEAIWLRRTGGETGHGVEVLAQIDGDWFIAITEDIRANFSHCAHLSSGSHNWKLSPLSGLAPLAVTDGRTPAELKRDGDDRWPDGSQYVPPRVARALDIIRFTVLDFEIAVSMRCTLSNAHAHLKRKYRGVPLWSFISDITGNGSTHSAAICDHYGWDAHQDAYKAELR